MSRVLVLLEHRENRRLLAEYLASRYSVISVDNDERSVHQILQEESFDLGIVDGPALNELRADIQQRKAAEPALCLPFLLVTSRPALRLAKLDLWKSIDDLILTPIERLELHARVEILLRARRYSVESEQRYFALAANSPVGVAIVQEQQVVYANNALLHILETERDNLKDSNLLGLFQLGHATQETAHPEEPASGDSASPREAHVDLSSGRHWIEIHSAPLQYHGRTAILYILADVTARKQAHLELQRAKREAEQLARLKSSLLDNLSHEIRTPLASMIGYADVMDDAAMEQVQEFTDIIKKNSQRLLDTLNAVIDLSMLESGAFQMAPQPVKLIEHVQETITHFRPQIDQRGLDVRITSPSEPAVQLVTDSAALHRILSSLISNAVKFTQQGAIAVSIKADDDAAVVQIADTGVGISPEFLPHIFTEFKQESSGMSRHFEGVGLGLTITKRLVELLGGDIDIVSQKGKGSVFTVRLPYHLPTPTASDEPARNDGAQEEQ